MDFHVRLVTSDDIGKGEYLKRVVAGALFILAGFTVRESYWIALPLCSLAGMLTMSTISKD